MIHATSISLDNITYNNVYLFLKLYMDSPGTAQSEAILYSDQSIKNQVGAIKLNTYTFEQLAINPMDTLHTLTISSLQQTNPSSSALTTETSLSVLRPTINSTNC